MLSLVKLLLKGEVGVCALKCHGNYIVDHGKSLKSHGIVFLNFCGNPEFCSHLFLAHLSRRLMGELIVYQSLRRPSVRPSVVRPSVRPSVNIFKHLLL